MKVRAIVHFQITDEGQGVLASGDCLVTAESMEELRVKLEMMRKELSEVGEIKWEETQ